MDQTEAVVFDFTQGKVLLRKPDGSTRDAPEVVRLVATGYSPPADPGPRNT